MGHRKNFFQAVYFFCLFFLFFCFVLQSFSHFDPLTLVLFCFACFFSFLIVFLFCSFLFFLPLRPFSFSPFDEIPPLFMALEQFLYVFVILDLQQSASSVSGYIDTRSTAVSLVSFSLVHFNVVCGWWVSLVSGHSFFLFLFRQVLPQSFYPDVSVVGTDIVLLHILSGRLFVSALHAHLLHGSSHPC